MEHRLLDGIREASDEILKLYDTLTGKTDVQGTPDAPANAAADAAQGAVPGQTALANGGKFMEQVLLLLAGEEGQTGETQSAGSGNGNAPAVQNGQNVQENQGGQENRQVQDSQSGVGNSAGAGAETADVIKGNPQETTAPGSDGGSAGIGRDTGKLPVQETVQQEVHPGEQQNRVQADQRPVDELLFQLRGEQRQSLPNKIVSLMREGMKDGRIGIKDVKQLLMDSELGRQLTTEEKAQIFSSEPFKSMLKSGLQRQWTLTPQELTQEGRVEAFYQKLAKESAQLTRMMNEAMQSGGQSGSSTPARAMGNISENVEFMNQMNQMFNYVQLPLKLGNSQAHGDLYVYTNKKNMARRDGMLTAFLHLDMDNLGALDVSISLQTERNQVTSKFYLDEEAAALVEEHIDELARRLSKKGYQCKNLILEKEEDKTVLDHIQEQVAGGSAVLSYQTFDTRA